MGNPVKSSQLYIHGSNIREAIDEFNALNDVVEKLKQQSITLTAEVKKTNVSQSAHRETIRKTAVEADRLEKLHKKYSKALSTSNIKIQELKKATSQANRQAKLQAQYNNAAEGSYDKLSAQYGLNKIKLNAMSDEVRKNTKEGQKLEKQTNAIYQEMKKLQEATGKHTLSVGDYKKATSDLFNSLRNAPGVFGRAASGVDGLGTSFKALAASPIGLFLTLIISTLTVLFGAFTKSKQGSDLMARASGALQGVLSVLVGVADRLANMLVDLWNEPQKSLKSFYEGVKTKILGVFNDLAIVGGGVYNILKSIVTLDFQGVDDGVSQVNEGFSNLANKAKGAGQEIKETISGAIKEVDALATSFVNLAQKKLDVMRANREIQKGVERLATEEAILQTIIDDTTKSFKEREDAAEKQRAKIEARANEEIKIARNNLSLINAELELRRGSGEVVDGLLDQQLAAYQTLAQAEREYSVAIRTNEKERNELKQDRLERDLDILIDAFDNQKTINEKMIASDKLPLEERERLLIETQRLSNESFQKQIETIQKFTGITIDSNELISESDAVVLNKKIRGLGLSEIIEGRVLEIVRDRKSANYDLAESEQVLLDAKIKAKEKLKADAKTLETEELKLFDEKQSRLQAEFDLEKQTEAAKTKFRLNAEKERLKEILRLNKEYGEKTGKAFSEDQIKTIEANIKGIDQKIAAIGKANDGDIYDLLGLNLGDDEKQVLVDSFSFAKGQLEEYLQKRIDVANQNVETRRNEVSEAQRTLQAEIDSRNAGYAHNVDTAKKELDDAKKRQKQALKEQRKAQREQQLIQSLEQAGNLITATSKIWAAQGANPFAAIVSTGLMWGSFIASKVKAAQLTKKIYRRGGWDILGGGSHESGNDTYLGYQSEGKPVFAEKGELNATINKENTRKYRGVLPLIVDSLNAGTFEHIFTTAHDNVKNLYVEQGTNTSNIEHLLREIRDKELDNWVTDKIKIVGDTTTIYV